MNTDSKEKITEPFYTTKSNGTGLGLPVVNAVVRAHYGKLSFFNQKEGGACFVMSLPISHQAVNKEVGNESL
ncbi:MAG: signal transduction histidine kinase [Bermanella sp.]